MRPGPTRVETYCSNDLLKVPRWRRSKLNTAICWLTAPSAPLVTPGAIPAADASADMLCTKEWKTPPQRAAKEGVERRTLATRMDAEERTKTTLFMTNHFLPEGRRVSCSMLPVWRSRKECASAIPMEGSRLRQGVSPTPPHPAPTRLSPRFRGAAKEAQHQNRSARSAHHLPRIPARNTRDHATARSWDRFRRGWLRNRTVLPCRR